MKAVFRFIKILGGETSIQIPVGFGPLCDQISNKLKNLGFEDLIEADAAWIRNAACHADWMYNASNQKLVLKDKRGIKKEFAPQEFMEKALHLYSMVVDNYFKLLTYYFRRKAFNDWKVILSYTQKNMMAIVNNDSAKTKLLVEKFQKDFLEIQKISFKN